MDWAAISSSGSILYRIAQFGQAALQVFSSHTRRAAAVLDPDNKHSLKIVGGKEPLGQKGREKGDISNPFRGNFEGTQPPSPGQFLLSFIYAITLLAFGNKEGYKHLGTKEKYPQWGNYITSSFISHQLIKYY